MKQLISARCAIGATTISTSHKIRTRKPKRTQLNGARPSPLRPASGRHERDQRKSSAKRALDWAGNSPATAAQSQTVTTGQLCWTGGHRQAGDAWSGVSVADRMATEDLCANHGWTGRATLFFRSDRCLCVFVVARCTPDAVNWSNPGAGPGFNGQIRSSQQATRVLAHMHSAWSTCSSKEGVYHTA
jgi:hypothetical protein